MNKGKKDQPEIIMIPEKLGKVVSAISDKGAEETVRIEDKNNLKNDLYHIPFENCDFETAITATGYGKYNVIILALCIFPLTACLVTTSTMSLVLPSAECDLNLSNVNKGMLNAITYIGMIISAFSWGFLSDTLGRQKLLVISYFIVTILSVIVGLSQNFTTLLTAKFFDGIMIAGPFAILMTYLAETHSAEHRAKTIQWTGTFSGLATIALPMLAWIVIPNSQLGVSLFDGVLNITSWRVFLLISSIPGFLSAMGFLFLHESPKFLMSRGQNDKALEALRAIYAMNSGLPPSTYPIKSLINEKLNSEKTNDGPKNLSKYLRLGWLQIKPLFQRPHLPYALLAFTIQFCTLVGLNTLRLWMPQLFSLMIDAEAGNVNNATMTTVCELFFQNVSAVEIVEEVNCTSIQVDAQVYINSTIIGIATSLGYFISGFCVKKIGKKWLIIICSFVGALCSGSMYWAVTSNVMLIVASIFVTLASISSTAVVSIVVDLFPTAMRSMAVGLTMMFGRTGAMLGNLVFPVLLDLSCTVPFFLIASIVFAAGLVTFAIPKTKGKALE